jgi:hypothetical protein
LAFGAYAAGNLPGGFRVITIFSPTNQRDSLLLCILSIHLKSLQRIIVAPTGLTVEQTTFTGKRKTRYRVDELIKLQATVHTKDLVVLNAEIKDAGEITLLCLPIEQFKSQAQFIVDALGINYVLAFSCPLSLVPRSRPAVTCPNFTRIDPLRRKLILERPDVSTIEIPFDQVTSISIIAQTEALSFAIDSAFPMYEYSYQPAILFSDGSTQLLQRFRSLEQSVTVQSDALTTAKKFAHYLQSYFDPAPQVGPSPKNQK